jgi:hypothetical protein
VTMCNLDDCDFFPPRQILTPFKPTSEKYGLIWSAGVRMRKDILRE